MPVPLDGFGLFLLIAAFMSCRLYLRNLLLHSIFNLLAGIVALFGMVYVCQ